MDGYIKLGQDIDEVKNILNEQGWVSKSAQVPWLEKLNIPYYLAGLNDDEIQSSIHCRRRVK
jgi:hypothetical protein